MKPGRTERQIGINSETGDHQSPKLTIRTGVFVHRTFA